MSASPAVPSHPAGSHLDYVEGLRAIAALIVYVNHAYAQAWNPMAGHFPPAVLSPLTYSLVAGHLSVTVFIVISGFCLTLPVVAAGDRLRGGARGFFGRRARRILPPYYGALALSLVLIATLIGDRTGSLWDVPIGVDRVAVVSHLLLLQDLFGTGKINYVLWSIAVEWHLYFLFPLLVWGARRYGIFRVVGVALLVGYAMRFGLADTRVVRANPQYLGLFALGMLAAYVVRSPRPEFERARRWTLWVWAAAALLLTACALSWLWGYRVATDRFHFLDLPVALMAVCLVVHAAGHETSYVARVLSFRPLVFIGTFSYSLYLVHAPLLQILWKFALVPAGASMTVMFVALMTVGLGVVLAAAHTFFRVFERPFLHSGKSARAPVAAGA
jgi:peptidoglycan/LPS O-acetylase OafA/YrhL